ncbi:integral membrane protein DUF92-domain-containing protein [Pisolithus orientalis]|uniref:integral membrane protein DUF92-domain-containing protein n=1 Tax=Pisolithus orientalis TaxID=936130 RepID=UPI002225AB06|nr:integral membrane protein DUF92-domain-containing protein [Pisolithus orientalis]KAI6008703.1 integral membrane protein DUF92-domain-containing protein [Pisolithus orientalis]
MTTFPVVPFVLATALAVNGARSRKLSPSGAATAFVVGFLVMAAPVRAIGVTLITFYLLASRATKYGKKRKAQLEEGFQDAGYRTGWQVLCNSIAAFIASIIWSVTFTPNVLPWSLLPSCSVPLKVHLYDTESWCPFRALLFIVLGQFACCLGDTLASELGILSTSRPILITTLKPVPPGTNGAISVGGTLASVVGGCVVGLTLFASLVADWMGILPSLVLWGTAAGVLGSMLDSFLGATIQRTRYSVDSKRVLQDASVPRDKESIKVIGGLNLLTNNQVRPVTST